jgi:transcription elongation factor Elf1
MKILQAAQNVLISRAVDIYVDMRDTVDSVEEYRNHFGNMGELIQKIETYNSFGDICTAVEKEQFGELGYCGDDEDLEAFLYDVKKYMEKSNK